MGDEDVTLFSVFRTVQLVMGWDGPARKARPVFGPGSLFFLWADEKARKGRGALDIFNISFPIIFIWKSN